MPKGRTELERIEWRLGMLKRGREAARKRIARAAKRGDYVTIDAERSFIRLVDASIAEEERRLVHMVQALELALARSPVHQGSS